MTKLTWNNPMTSTQAEKWLMTKGLVAQELLDATIEQLRAAEARAMQLEAERDELARKLEQARAELHFFHNAFPYATKKYRALGEWESETPLGQTLDGLGDEVES